MNSRGQLMTVLPLTTCFANGQDVFIYDQQSSDESNFQEGGLGIQQNQPIGQSFTPNLDSIGFVRLYIYDGFPGGGPGSTLYLNLRADSITGTVLASTDPLAIPSHFSGPVDLIFANAAPVYPGVTYFFQPVVDTDTCGLNASSYHYSGGTAFYDGLPASSSDLWFREGIVIPEPASVWLVLMGGGVWVFIHHTRHRRRRLCRISHTLHTPLSRWSADL